MSAPANPVVRWLARLICRIFYRVDLIGAPPPDGPALLMPNHPNALLDPTVVWAAAGRDMRFLAKSTLFDGAFRPFLVGAGAIPVYRKLDQGADVSRNTETFAAVSAALADGDAVCIFPEGISHSSGRLEPLRTGAARMALAAEREGTAVALVPVGLNFDRKTAFRSRATIVFGQPFSCRDLLPSGDDQYPAAVRALTARIAEHMRRLLIEAEPNSRRRAHRPRRPPVRRGAGPAALRRGAAAPPPRHRRRDGSTSPRRCGALRRRAAAGAPLRRAPATLRAGGSASRLAGLDPRRRHLRGSRADARHRPAAALRDWFRRFLRSVHAHRPDRQEGGGTA